MYETRKRLFFSLVFFLFFILFFVLISNLTKQHLPQRHIAVGAWTEGLFDSKKKTLHPEKLRQFEQLIHKKVRVAHYYIGWESLADPTIISQFATLRANGWEPMLNVNPYYFPKCPPTFIPLYRAIAQGKCDTFLREAGKNLSHVNQPFYLLFAWEMNNKDNEWSISYTGSTPKDFIAAWQHIHTVFKKEKVTKVIWVFCPNVPDVANLSYKTIYPGDMYVDWFGLDGYNWGTTQPWSQWSSFSGVFTDSYEKITTISPKKPLMIAEVNTTDQGGNKGAWYKDMFTAQIPYHFQNIKTVVMFNEKRSNQHVDWRINTTQDSLQAFIMAIHLSFYQ